MLAKEKQHIVKEIIFFGILLICIILMFASFVRANHEYILSQNADYIKDATSQSVQRIDETLTTAQAGITTIATLYGSTLSKPEVDFDKLEQLMERFPFNHIEFVNKDGINTNKDGQEVNVTDRSYYIEGMKGNSGMDVIRDSRISDKNQIIFYSPLRYKEEIIGILIGHYEEKQMEKILSCKFFDEIIYTYLCLPNGEIIARSSNASHFSNVFENPNTKKDLTPDIVTKLSDVFEKGEAYEFTFSRNNNQGKACIQKLEHGNWILLQAFPPQITNKMISHSKRTGVILLTELIVLFAIYLILILVKNRKANKVLVSDNREMTCVVNGITQLFARFIIIDLEKDTYQYVANTSPLHNNISASGKYGDLIDYFTSMIIHDDEKDHLKFLLQKEQVQKNMDPDTPHLRYEYYIKREKPIWENLNLICLKRTKDGLPSTLLFTQQDVSDVKEEELRSHVALKEAYQAMETANRAKSDFLANMSHDIRTPMNAIMGMTSIASMHIHEPERIQDCLDKITGSSRHLLGLINEVLDMSKIESGKVDLAEEAFNLSGLIENVTAIFLPQTKTKNQKFEINIGEIKHEEVIGDAIRLQQVFVNILGNAVKFTPENGTIRFTISEGTSRIRGAAHYEFICEDTGIGMEPAFLQRIFEPFARADNSCTGKIEGTGLGMPIAKNIIQMMNGDISVESELGKGSRFTVTLYLKLNSPKEETVSGAHSEPDLSEENQKKTYTGKRVLLVEDNELNREIATEILSMLGLSVDEAFDGKQGVDCVLEKPAGYYDLIFMDIQMPNMNGYEATTAIRNSDREDLKKIPIIAMSANAFTDDIAQAKRAGMNDHVAKPVEIPLLVKILETYIS